MKRLLIVACLMVSGCISARVALDPNFDPEAKPSYEDYVDYWLLGLVGDPTLNLQKICVDQKPYGLRRMKTPVDGFITLVTLGVYSPATVRVWCGN
jgi:hypothetical protein